MGGGVGGVGQLARTISMSYQHHSPSLKKRCLENAVLVVYREPYHQVRGRERRGGERERDYTVWVFRKKFLMFFFFNF